MGLGVEGRIPYLLVRPALRKSYPGRREERVGISGSRDQREYVSAVLLCGAWDPGTSRVEG